MTIFFVIHSQGSHLQKTQKGVDHASHLPRSQYPNSSPLAHRHIKPTSWWQGRLKKAWTFIQLQPHSHAWISDKKPSLAHSIRCWTLAFHSIIRQTVRLGPSAQVPKQLPDGSRCWLTTHDTLAAILSHQLVCVFHWTSVSVGVWSKPFNELSHSSTWFSTEPGVDRLFNVRANASKTPTCLLSSVFWLPGNVIDEGLKWELI